MYPESLDVTEGESLEIPFFGKVNSEAKKSKYSFLKLCSQPQPLILEDLFTSLKIGRSEDGLYNVLQIPSLQEGEYVLKMKKLDKKIYIKVHRGEYWNNENIIMKKNELSHCNPQALKMIKITDVQVENKQVDACKVTIQLKDQSAEARVHVFAQHFIPTNAQNLYKSLLRVFSQRK